MGLTDINAVTSKMKVGNYNQAWLSITDNDAIVKPQVYSKLFKQYGPNAMLVEVLKLFGSTIDVPDATITTIEKTWPQRVIKTKTAIVVGAAGATITVVLDVSSANDVNWVEGDVILVPAEFQAATISSSRGYRCVTFSTTTWLNDTCVCYPLSNAATTVSASDIDTQIPAGTYMSIAYNVFAVGTGQPGGVRDSFTKRTHTSFLSKFTVGLEGNIMATPYYEVSELEGTGKFTSQKLIEMEFRLQEAQAHALLTGEPNDNTSLVVTSDFGGSNAIKSGMGIYQWADTLGLKHTYAVTPEFADFYTIGQLLASQDITGSTVDWFTGFKFQQDIELAGLDWVKEFSSGSDLYSGMEKKLGFVLKAVTLGGLTHVFYNLPEMSKAGGLGLLKAGEYVYEFPEMALGIPRENVSYESFGSSGQAKSIPNLTMFRVNHNGENNSKVLKRQLGVSGADGGLDVAVDSHGVTYWMLAQYGLVAGECNKWVLLRKAK
jgi:hypothetical protein